MKLKVSRSTKNKVVTLELSTSCFTDIENAMLDQLGEPVITFDKVYGNNAVKFSKKIRSNFRVRVKFDANLESDTDVTADYIDEFLDELQDKLSDAMSKVSDEYNTSLVPKEEFICIKY